MALKEGRIPRRNPRKKPSSPAACDIRAGLEEHFTNRSQSSPNAEDDLPSTTATGKFAVQKVR